MSYPKCRLTNGYSRIAAAAFFDHFLLAKWVYNVIYRANPQSAEPKGLGPEAPMGGPMLMLQIPGWK